MTIHQDIDKLFKKGLSDYSEKPPGFAWDNIEQSLNRKRFKQRRNLVYSLAASIAILLSFGAGYLLTDGQPKNQIAVNQNNDATIITSKKSEISDRDKNITEDKNTKIDDDKTEQVSIQPEIYKNNSTSTKELKENTTAPAEKKLKKSNVKKVNSSGILLPPMFASSDEFEKPTATITEEQTDKENAILNHLKMKNFDFAELDSKRELNYDYRQITPIPDYTLTINDVKNTSPWSVGFSAAPLVSYRNVSDVSSDQYKL